MICCKNIVDVASLKIYTTIIMTCKIMSSLNLTWGNIKKSTKGQTFFVTVHIYIYIYIIDVIFAFG